MDSLIIPRVLSNGKPKPLNFDSVDGIWAGDHKQLHTHNTRLGTDDISKERYLLKLNIYDP